MANPSNYPKLDNTGLEVLINELMLEENDTLNPTLLFEYIYIS